MKLKSRFKFHLPNCPGSSWVLQTQSRQSSTSDGNPYLHHLLQTWLHHGWKLYTSEDPVWADCLLPLLLLWPAPVISGETRMWKLKTVTRILLSKSHNFIWATAHKMRQLLLTNKSHAHALVQSAAAEPFPSTWQQCLPGLHTSAGKSIGSHMFNRFQVTGLAC